MGSPRKGVVSTRGETLAKELNLERSDFVFDRQPDAFRSGRAHHYIRKFKVRISSHTRDEDHNICGFSLPVVG